MAKKQAFGEKSKDTRSKNIRKISQEMKKENPNQEHLSKSNLKEDVKFFIKPSENLDIKDVINSKQYSASFSSSINTEKDHEIVSSNVSNSKEKIKQVGNECVDSDKKKPFDKKLFRLKKYSKKYKLQQWEEKRKKTAFREYQRSFNKIIEPKQDISKIYEEEYSNELKSQIDADNEGETLQRIKNKKPFLKPHERYKQIKEEKQRKMEDIARKRLEREEAKKKALKERMERNKKLK